ncbi:MAG: polysaccharide deacetylase family protein [Pseudomonadota bacterium]
MFDIARALFVLPLLFLAWGGATAQPLAPVRFLLTFDDGPDLGTPSLTEKIQQQLAHNPVMPGIKALFFVQANHTRHGDSDLGRKLMRDTCAAGHLMGLHSGTPRGHIPHPRLAPAELAESLLQGNLAIEQQCPGRVSFVRPPDWVYTDATLAAYQSAQMEMLQADASVNDGKVYGWIISPRRRAHLHNSLERVARVRAAGLLPEVDGVLPIIVALHDTNSYTAEHMTEYLQILVEESAAVGLPLAGAPFYADRDAMVRAAHVRAQKQLYVCDKTALAAPIAVRLGLKEGDARRGCFPPTEQN